MLPMSRYPPCCDTQLPRALPHIATPAPARPPTRCALSWPPDPTQTPAPISRYPAPISRHSRPEPFSWPGGPHPEVPRPRIPPTGSAPPLSRRTVPARTAALVPFRRPRDRRRRLTTSSRRARAREEEGGVTWAAAASRGGGRRARDAGRAHSAPFRRGQSERGGRGLERGRGLARGRGFSSHARCGPSWGGALGELGWGRE